MDPLRRPLKRTSGPQQFNHYNITHCVSHRKSPPAGALCRPPPMPVRLRHPAKILHDDKLCKIFAINLNCLAIMQRGACWRSCGRCVHSLSLSLTLKAEGTIFLQMKTTPTHARTTCNSVRRKRDSTMYNCVRPSTISTMRSATVEEAEKSRSSVCRFSFGPSQPGQSWARFQFA